jgi:hypothetical protein
MVCLESNQIVWRLNWLLLFIMTIWFESSWRRVWKHKKMKNLDSKKRKIHKSDHKWFCQLFLTSCRWITPWRFTNFTTAIIFSGLLRRFDCRLTNQIDIESNQKVSAPSESKINSKTKIDSKANRKRSDLTALIVTNTALNAYVFLLGQRTETWGTTLHYPFVKNASV